MRCVISATAYGSSGAAGLGGEFGAKVFGLEDLAGLDLGAFGVGHGIRAALEPFDQLDVRILEEGHTSRNYLHVALLLGRTYAS